MNNRLDPSGTTPGLAPASEPKPKTFNMRCKVEKCDSMEVVEITPKLSIENAGAPSVRTYRCVKCNYTWTIPVGGFVNF